MPRLPHLAALAFTVVMGVGQAAAQAPLSKASPFLPTASAAEPTTAPNETLSLAGVSGSGKAALVCIYDGQTKRSHWIPVGSTVEGINVLSYDFARDQVSITVGGQQKVLTLRTTKISAASSAPAPINVGYTAPVPVAAPIPAPTQGTPQPPPAPGSVAQQETEARMLVSDLLEIGMQQRKAYEEAQKKAAEEKKKS